FEASDYIGGHVNTIDVTLQDGKKAKPNKVEKSAIDTGFIVFNERTYPNFFRLLHELQVPFQATDMSFSVKNAARHFEYNGHTLNTLLSQRKNLLNPKFWGFINDILQFNKQVRQLRQDYDKAREQGQDIAVFTKQTLGEYLDTKKYGDLFTDNYLLPMVSAIWSTSLRDVQDFPLVFFAQFFDNHGLLDVVNRPQWFTIKGGSKQYVNKLIKRFVKAGGSVSVKSPVQSVTRKDNKVILSVTDTTDNKTQGLVFDEVIFACHADTALKILQDANPTEQEVLNHFTFTDNTA
ncbi:FAD-dependent oxidoreductase, partial [Psychrobacter sp. 16-Bac2893]